jgi:hypothetical protein
LTVTSRLAKPGSARGCLDRLRLLSGIPNSGAPLSPRTGLGDGLLRLKLFRHRLVLCDLGSVVCQCLHHQGGAGFEHLGGHHDCRLCLALMAAQ